MYEIREAGMDLSALRNAHEHLFSCIILLSADTIVTNENIALNQNYMLAYLVQLPQFVHPRHDGQLLAQARNL